MWTKHKYNRRAVPETGRMSSCSTQTEKNRQQQVDFNLAPEDCQPTYCFNALGVQALLVRASCHITSSFNQMDVSNIQSKINQSQNHTCWIGWISGIPEFYTFLQLLCELPLASSALALSRSCWAYAAVPWRFNSSASKHGCHVWINVSTCSDRRRTGVGQTASWY